MTNDTEQTAPDLGGITTAEALAAAERIAEAVRSVPIDPALEARYAEIVRRDAARARRWRWLRRWTR